MAGGPLESSDLDDPVGPSNSQRTPNETCAKQVFTDSASGGETPIKQPVVGTACRLSHGKVKLKYKRLFEFSRLRS